MERALDIDEHKLWNRLRTAGWIAAAIILLLPAIAMQFTQEVAWTPSDFVFAAVLLGGTGIVFELVLRKSGSSAYRLGALFALTSAFLMIWISGAVGIIGNEGNPANLMYVGVLGTAVFGTLAARFRPGALSIAMVATALMQTVVTVIAMIGTRGTPADDPLKLLVLNGFFIALWLLAAALFRKAAGKKSATGQV
ncbi:MAG: hypothetical protein ABR524_07785 [Thermoanaerobaculia bacterium]